MNSDVIAALFAGAYLLICMIASIIYGVVMVIAEWNLLKKAGEPGWKSLIPFYNKYTLYKITWKPIMFWIILGISIASSIFLAITDGGSEAGSDVSSNPAIIILTLLCYLVTIAIELVQRHKLSKAYGQGVGFTLGLIFLYPIFMLILGLGNSQYVGNDYKEQLMY